MALCRGESLPRESAIDPGGERFRIDTLLRRRRISHVFTLPSQESFDRSVALAGILKHWSIQVTALPPHPAYCHLGLII